MDLHYFWGFIDVPFWVPPFYSQLIRHRLCCFDVGRQALPFSFSQWLDDNLIHHCMYFKFVQYFIRMEVVLNKNGKK